MTNPTKILEIARGEVGYNVNADLQRGSKYGRWYAQKFGASFGGSGVPYCAMFVSWVYDQAHTTVDGLPSAHCPSILNAWKKAGILIPLKNARAGDLVVFDWDGGVVDHIGIVTGNTGTHLLTIEGNTTTEAGRGSQSNGGRVAERKRAYRFCKAVARPTYEKEKVKLRRKMFTFRVNTKGGIYFYDGQVHPLHHEHELDALKQAFEQAGYDLPHVEIGNSKEPWGTRLLDALTRENDHKLTLK